MIEIQNLTRKYGDTVAVRDFSVEIERGEIVGLLGHNGAGKTTVMKMLTGYLEPSAGSITVDGQDVVTHRTEVQRKLGYLPEAAPLYPEMLVQEYLLMMAELRGVPEADRTAAVARAVDATGLHKHLLAPIDTLSRGYRQRVGLAQAIVHKPDVLVLDEPTNGLDPIQVLSIRKLITQLRQDATVILSTHILQEVEAVCDRVLVMIDGHLAADAPMQELLSSDTIHLCVNSDALGVAETLSELPDVASVSRAPSRSAREGFAWWAIATRPDCTPIPDIIKAGVRAGWTIDAVAREQRTLESVFQQLQAEHIERLPGDDQTEVAEERGGSR